MKKQRSTLLEGFMNVPRILEEARRVVDEVTQSGQPSEHPSEHPTEQVNSQASTLPSSLTPKGAPYRAGEQPSEQLSEHPTEQLSAQPNKHASAQLSEQPTEHPSEQTKTRLDEELRDPIYWLPDNYSQILVYLIEQKSRITRLEDISKITMIPFGTVRRALKKLTEVGFISQCTQYRKGRVRGFSYHLNEPLCYKFLRIRCEHPSEHLTEQATEHPSEHLTEQATEWTPNRASNRTPSYYSSSSFFKVPTTTKEIHNLTISIEETLANHPELGYWRQKGLTAKQIEQWMKLTGSTLHNMIQSLCHCRFEMVELGLEESKPIENVFNWFFRVIERAGYYPAPKGYKSYLDKQIELEKQALAEQEQKLQELREIQQAKIDQERELAFREMLANPEGELYQTCYNRLNHFAQRTARIELFEMAMRKAFDEVMAERYREVLETDQGVCGQQKA